MPDSRPAPRARYDFRRLLDADVSLTSLSLVRVLFHGVLLVALARLYGWRSVAFEGYPPVLVHSLFAAAFLLTSAVLVGVVTRVALVLNACLLRLLFGLCQDPYHLDKIFIHFEFLFVFAPLPQRWTVDGRRRSVAADRAPGWFVALLTVAITLAYWDSVWFKLQSEIWLGGSAFWLGAALPHFSTGMLPDWAESAVLMKTLTYSALVYELLFPLIVVRGTRSLWLALGLALHVGSAVFFPLPLFGLAFATLLLLYLPVNGRARVGSVPRRHSRLATYGSALLISGLVASQVWLAAQPIGLTNPLSAILGTTRHPLFLDWHFRLSGPILRFTTRVGGREISIPSFSEDGYPEVSGRYWKLLGFFARGTREGPGAQLRYLRGWFASHDLEPGVVDVYCKNVTLSELALDFELDDREAATPWRLAGTIDVRDGAARLAGLADCRPPQVQGRKEHTAPAMRSRSNSSRS